MQEKLKIGIIQNAPLTADLSNNLRQIVQGYRECLDHGANLIIAPACALCGADLGNLSERLSFARQAEAALESLARELGDTPLITASYVPMPVLDDGHGYFPGNGLEEPILPGVLTPYLLENGDITELEEPIDIGAYRVFVDLGDELDIIEAEGSDLIVHLNTEPWYAGAPRKQEDNYQWEAKEMGMPVVWVNHIGTSDGNIYAGGSAVFNPAGNTICRLPFFETCNKVIDLKSRKKAIGLPLEEETLCMALERGIRDTVRNNGYSGVCLDLTHPNADLLAALCVEALGCSNVVGITSDEDSHIPAALKISCTKLPTAPLLDMADTLVPDNSKSLKSRLNAAVQFSYAESRGLMYLCPLTRSNIMLGNFDQYGDSCGHFAPLGNLYEVDIFMLRRYLAGKYTDLFGTIQEPSADSDKNDLIIHELADLNISANTLLNDHVCPYPENEVRLIQRKIIASALKRTQLPMVLHTDPRSEQLVIPVTHRLND
ncbi:MAG: hypothetical protein IJ503_03795 [Akkermansia sp.]|nr:hypothetical protein [Akkermansia sp.]